MNQPFNTISITGHRGACGYAPENTLASIKMALEQKVHRIEVDVQQTKDNILILLHDSTLDRTTTGKGKVKDLTYEEILHYSAGKQPPNSNVHEHVPTLEEALSMIDGKALLLIEIKMGSDYYPTIEKNVLELIKKHLANDWCIICSFDDKILRKVHTSNKEIPIHKLMAGKRSFLPRFFETTINSADLKKYHFVEEISVHHRLITKRFVDKVHKMNKKINVWTVNDRKRAGKLLKIGVDGIITDYPDKMNGFL